MADVAPGIEVTMGRILRVFPIRTSHTPTDDLVRIGDPDLLPVPDVDEVHISCVFTWHREECHRLADAWQLRLPKATVKVGGPGFGDRGDEFTPGFYVRSGITITSRGCPERCKWCYVPDREGRIRLLPIREGHIIQDNNLLACSQEHFAAVCEMLSQQPKAARFVGGFQIARFRSWHLDCLYPLRIREIWTAFDEWHTGNLGNLRLFREIAMQLPTINGVQEPRRKLRCYVLIGRNGERIQEARHRLECVWGVGYLPFAQIFCNDDGQTRCGPEWRALAREWSRPAAMFAQHKP